MALFVEGKLFKRAGEGSGGGGGDQHNLGWYATQAALEEAHPTAEAGDWAIVGATDTVWIWDTDNSAWVDSDQKGQVTSVNGQTGAVTVSEVPSQTGNSGKFLTTDGTDASWSDKPLVNKAPSNKSSVIITPNGTVSEPNLNNSVSISPSSGFIIGNVKSVAISASGRASGIYSTNIGGFDSSGADSIQLGGSRNAYSNSDANTFKVGNANGNFEIMSADGTIPTARLTKVNSTITLTAAGWSSNTQTVNVTGMTATGVVFVSPDPTDQSAYTSNGILCTGQATNSLTFTATTTPTNDIDVNIVCL